MNTDSPHGHTERQEEWTTGPRGDRVRPETCRSTQTSVSAVEPRLSTDSPKPDSAGSVATGTLYALFHDLQSRVCNPKSAIQGRMLREFVGSLADLGTLLPLTIALIAYNGLGARPAIALLGITYILVGVHYRLPVPVQPLKAAAMIAIATGASVGQIRAAALWMAGIMLVLGFTRLADRLNYIFPRVLVHGLQFGLGIMMVTKGVKFVISYPDSLGSVVLNAHAHHGVVAVEHGLFPSGMEFWSAFSLLVLPQIPLTLGNAVLATRDCALKYFGRPGRSITPSRLATTIGLGNLAAGLVGGVPICHGAGGMTAHYRLGARTGAAPVLLGSLLLTVAIAAGRSAPGLLSAVPAWGLGALLTYVGVRHAALARESLGRAATAAAVLSMGIVGFYTSNLMASLGIGLAVKILVQDAPEWIRRRAISAGQVGAEVEP